MTAHWDAFSKAAHFDVGEKSKVVIIICEGCGQGARKQGGRKCFCGPCAYTNQQWMRRIYDKRRRLSERIRKDRDADLAVERGGPLDEG